MHAVNATHTHTRARDGAKVSSLDKLASRVDAASLAQIEQTNRRASRNAGAAFY